MTKGLQTFIPPVMEQPCSNLSPAKKTKFAFKFGPVEGQACTLSIPLADEILSSIIDTVIQHDDKKDADARERAIKLSINAAWTVVFDNQVSLEYFFRMKFHTAIFCLVL